MNVVHPQLIHALFAEVSSEMVSVECWPLLRKGNREKSLRYAQVDTRLKWFLHVVGKYIFSLTPFAAFTFLSLLTCTTQWPRVLLTELYSGWPFQSNCCLLTIDFIYSNRMTILTLKTQRLPLRPDYLIITKMQIQTKYN